MQSGYGSGSQDGEESGDRKSPPAVGETEEAAKEESKESSEDAELEEKMANLSVGKAEEGGETGEQEKNRGKQKNPGNSCDTLVNHIRLLGKVVTLYYLDWMTDDCLLLLILPLLIFDTW